jgi:hypothetical protein
LDDFQPYFPTVEEDLYGSISAIFLLQDTYNISAHDMASGNIPGKLNQHSEHRVVGLSSYIALSS